MLVQGLQAEVQTRQAILEKTRRRMSAHQYKQNKEQKHSTHAFLSYFQHLWSSYSNITLKLYFIDTVSCTKPGGFWGSMDLAHYFELFATTLNLPASNGYARHR